VGKCLRGRKRLYHIATYQGLGQTTQRCTGSLTRVDPEGKYGPTVKLEQRFSAKRSQQLAELQCSVEAEAGYLRIYCLTVVVQTGKRGD
jgi:hypothetical protein